MKTVIIDFGVGNLKSIQHKLKRIDVQANISSEPKEVENADILILPGVGHFSAGMKNLSDYGLIPILNKVVIEEKKPIFGICLGMQLFTSWSEEGNVRGLGWVDAVTKKFNFKDIEKDLKVPHVGWNTIKKFKENQLFDGIGKDQKFYFVHSYYVECNNVDNVLSETEYGINFVSSLQNNNIFGTQFHPEKSNVEGMQIFYNFIKNYIKVIEK